MRKKLEILLKPRTRVCRWIKNQTLNVEIGVRDMNGRKVRSLKIRNGEALFSPGGGVIVKMPGSSEFWLAFGPMKVLEIRKPEKDGAVSIIRNHHLCTECGLLSGQAIASTPGLIAGRMDISFKCNDCGFEWEFRNT